MVTIVRDYVVTKERVMRSILHIPTSSIKCTRKVHQCESHSNTLQILYHSLWMIMCFFSVYLVALVFSTLKTH